MPQRLTDPQEIFEACLRAVQRGDASIEECVRRYPEVQDLDVLLRTALALRALGAESLTVQQRIALERRLSAAYALRVRPTRRGMWRALAAVAAISVVFGLMALLAATALNSLPNEPLYGVKRMLERLNIALNGDSPQLLAAHARERLQELDQLVIRGAVISSSVLEDAFASLQRALNALPVGAERDALRTHGIRVLEFVARLRPESRETALRFVQALLPTPTATPQDIVAAQPSATPTLTLTATPTPSPTHTPSPTVTHTPSPTLTPSPTATVTIFTLIIPLPTQLPSLTPSPTLTPTRTLPTAAPLLTSPLPTLTPTATPFGLPPVNASPTLPPVLPTDTPRPTSVGAPSPTATPTRTLTPTETPSPTLTETPSLTPTETPSLTPTETLTPSATPTLSPCDPFAPPPPLRFDDQGTPLPTFTPTPCATYTPTSTPTPEPSPTLVETPSSP